MKAFKNKVALITGAGSGIGKAAALLFAKDGAKVIAVDKTAKSGRETVKAITEKKGEAIFVLADLSKQKEVKNAIDEAIKAFGRIDFAHNNAGIGGIRKSIVELEENEWDEVINANLKSVWLCMKHELRVMLERNIKGTIVNTASTWSFVGAPMAGAYVASKHGILGLTKTAALEYASRGIRINAVCPGATQTPLLRLDSQPEREAKLARTHPLGRLGKPDEIAAAVVWLCSGAASFITGQGLVVDGGFLAQ